MQDGEDVVLLVSGDTLAAVRNHESASICTCPSPSFVRSRVTTSRFTVYRWSDHAGGRPDSIVALASEPGVLDGPRSAA